MFYLSDNQAANEIRPVRIVPDYISTAEGSTSIEIGNTRVVSTVSIEETGARVLAQ